MSSKERNIPQQSFDRSQQSISQQSIQRNIPQNINFTQPNSMDQVSQSPSPQDINNPMVQERGITDLGVDIDELEIRNKFLESLVSIYESNPLKINSYLVCHSNTLMELIKILTCADKIELIINEDMGCKSCTSTSKFMEIDKIIVYKDDK